MRVTAILHRTKDDTRLDTYETEAPTWDGCVRDILSWLRIEVLPHWGAGDLRLSWPDDTDMQAAAALYGVGLSYYLIKGAFQDGCPPIMRFLSLALLAQRIIDNQDMHWQEKYDAIFSDDVRGAIEQTGVKLEWTDPDTTYEEDVLAYGRAVAQKADELRKTAVVEAP